jgi:hypothetical protein
MTALQSIDITSIQALLKREPTEMSSEHHVAAIFFEKINTVFDATMSAFVVVLELNQKLCHVKIDRHSMVMSYPDEPLRQPFVFSFGRIRARDLDVEETKKKAFFTKFLMVFKSKLDAQDCKVMVQKREQDEVSHEHDQ